MMALYGFAPGWRNGLRVWIRRRTRFSTYARWIAPVLGWPRCVVKIVKVAVLFIAIVHASDMVAQAEDSRWQTLANQVTAALKAGPVYINEVESMRGGRYYCREMRIDLGLAGANQRPVLAHELGHHVRRDCGDSFAQEAEANALAVTILGIWGETPERAASWIARWLYLNRVNTLGTHDFCGELADLLSRYPVAKDPRAPGECVTKAGR